MPGKKTSVEQTRDDEKLAKVGNMLDAAFGDVSGLQVAPEEEMALEVENEPVEGSEAEEAPQATPEPVEAP
ncbi:hypothetical protein N9A87_02760, partial [Euryarchaeota archaeon]|nr:hypothetical protein [Euryarchaeota archaeon]